MPKADCPFCNGTGTVVDPQDGVTITCVPCDGNGLIGGTQDELFSILRWSPVVLLIPNFLLFGGGL